MHINVFLPFSVFHSKSGILLGHYSEERSCYYVLSGVAVETYLSNCNASALRCEEKCEILGLWIGSDENTKLASTVCRSDWIILKKSSSNLSLIYVQIKREIEIVQSHVGVIFLYNKNDIFESERRLPKFQQYLNPLASINSTAGTISSTPNGNENCQSPTETDFLRQIVDAEMILLLYNHVLRFHSKLKTCSVNTGSKLFFQSFLHFLTKLFGLKFFWRLLLRLLTCFDNFAPEQIATFSSVGAHFSLKLKLLASLCSTEITPQHKKDVALSIIFDCIIGMLFCLWIFNYSSLNFYASEILKPYVEIIAKNVEILIRWLMGIPIGLKLNSPLNEFLGKFFLHHVRLWLEYIQMILVAFAPENNLQIAWTFFVCCFGFSFFIALLSDVVSLLTFHIYCFYVYATRLYGLQIAGVMSFWRLFRGKKWNPLRNRVDTLPHSPDIANHRFFTGTLLFTMLLFLLPTTALYYAIFAVLRLATLCIQKPLHWLCSCVTCFPWFSLGLRCMKPNAFVTHARFDRTDAVTCDKPQDAEMILKKISLPMKLRKMFVQDLTILAMTLDAQSYRSVICSGLKRSFGRPLCSSLNLRDFSISLFSGKLIKWS